MPVGSWAGVPLQVLAPTVGRRAKRQPDPDVGATEHARGRVAQKGVEHPTGVRVGQRERGAQVVEQVVGDRGGLGEREQFGHGHHPAGL
jgi:hypothetical protein